LAEKAGGTCRRGPTSFAHAARTSSSEGSRDAAGAERLAQEVVRAGGEAQPHARAIQLLARREEPHQPRGLPQAHHEHAGRERVERAGVARLLDAEAAAHAFDDVV
jgi:hypothetical protein